MVIGDKLKELRETKKLSQVGLVVRSSGGLTSAVALY